MLELQVRQKDFFIQNFIKIKLSKITDIYVKVSDIVMSDLELSASMNKFSISHEVINYIKNHIEQIIIYSDQLEDSDLEMNERFEIHKKIISEHKKIAIKYFDYQLLNKQNYTNLLQLLEDYEEDFVEIERYHNSTDLIFDENIKRIASNFYLDNDKYKIDVSELL